MPPPYVVIPQLADWQYDSSKWYASRADDHVLLTIDDLVSAYHNPALVAMQQDTLFYLRSALLFWMGKINAIPKNTAPTGLNSTNLPAQSKVSGAAARTPALQSLLNVVNSELRSAFGVGSDGALRLSLVNAYQATNGGVVADQHWLNGAGHAAVSVFLTDAGVQRMYKLRYRGGIAWRWNPVSNCYSVFDSTDNRESETNDMMVHFVMNLKGAIYAGFDKGAVWFKHSSLVGGEDALAAGRMKVEQGVVTFVQNDSGHFSPNLRHMLNLLNRLRLYGSSLTNTRVCRHSDRTVFTSQNMLAHPSSWPDGAVGF